MFFSTFLTLLFRILLQRIGRMTDPASNLIRSSPYIVPEDAFFPFQRDLFWFL